VRLRADVLAILTRHDVAGIADEEDPDAASGYEPEADTVLPRLLDARTADDVERNVTEEFIRWFGRSTFPATTDLHARFSPVADDLWDAVYRYRATE